MYTKEQLLNSIPDVPATFSIEELVTILDRPQTTETPEAITFPPRPANLTPEEAAEWDYYTSPEAMAIYAKVRARYPASKRVRSLRGIAAGLSPEDRKKTYKEWQAEAIQAKHGV